MKTLIGFLALFLPISFASAKTVTIDVADEVTYEHLTAYADGTTFIEQPRIYGLYIRAITIAEADDNTTVLCAKLKMKPVDNYGERLDIDERAVTYHTTSGPAAEPSFTTASSVLQTVICKP